MQRLKIYFLATRPQFFTAIILPVGLGAAVASREHRTFFLSYFLIAAAYISIVVGVILKNLPPLILLALFAAIPGIMAIKGLFKNYDKFVELVPSLQATIATHLATGIALIVIFLAS